MNVNLKISIFTIEKNKQIKLIIIDSINNFPVFEQQSISRNPMNKGQNYGNYGQQTIKSKDKSHYEFYNYNSTDKKVVKQLMKLVEEAKNIRDIGFIVTKKEIYAANEMIGFNLNERCLHANNRILKIFLNSLFKEGSHIIFLMNFCSFEEAALNLIYNDMEILQKLDSFNLQSYSVADIVHNGNISFAIKYQNKVSEILCFNVNKSNFFYLKSYPCILMDT